MTIRRFQSIVWSWYRANGRRGPRASRRASLPWRKFPRSLPANRQAYRILVSEVMLQQTQVSRVIRKYPEFLRAFPTLAALDRAPLSAVLARWHGLGYNRRALYLKQSARAVMTEHRGRIPADPELLRGLPGIGPGTAGAIAAFAFDRRVAFIETNIRRVFIHHFFGKRRRVSDTKILEKIRQTLPRRRIREWYYALMDYGALGLKGIPNPNRRSARYTRGKPFAGSRRELRGKILATVVQGPILRNELKRRINGAARPIERRELEHALNGLVREGLVKLQAHHISLPYE